jgi:hypothetical protein
VCLAHPTRTSLDRFYRDDHDRSAADVDALLEAQASVPGSTTSPRSSTTKALHVQPDMKGSSILGGWDSNPQPFG